MNEPDRILDALSDELASEGTVVGYVAVVTYMDTDGDSHILSAKMRDQRCHQTLGLLAFADAIERRRAADTLDETP